MKLRLSLCALFVASLAVGVIGTAGCERSSQAVQPETFGAPPESEPPIRSLDGIERIPN